MAEIKRKRIRSKDIQAAIDLNYKKAAFLYNDKEQLEELLKTLDKYILNNTTIIDTFDDLRKHIEILRDTVNNNCAVLSPEYIITILSALMYLNTSFSDSSSNDNTFIDRSVLLSRIDKKYKNDIKEYDIWEKWYKPGIYPITPFQIIDKKEEKSLDLLSKRYEKLTEPTIVGKASKQVQSLVPEYIQTQLAKVTDTITNQQLYLQIMDVVAEGFDLLVKNTAKVSLSEDYIVNQLNKTLKDNHIFTLEQVCYVRGYDISRNVNKFKTQNILTAFAEGGATGLAGLPGIPANLAASMFLYYRAIQSIALYYGYDVKNNPDELQIATDVFMQALSPTSGSTSEMGDMIVKFMSMTEALVIKDTLKGGWKAMAERGGICLLLTQIRGLAHKSAGKAIEAAGKKAMEKTMFTNFFEQLGKKMTQESIKKAATPAAALITAVSDMNTMNKVIEFADIFYNKRFITEKQTRIELLESVDIIEDVDFDIIDD